MNKIEIKNAMNSQARRALKKFRRIESQIPDGQENEFMADFIKREHEPLKPLGISISQFKGAMRRVAESYKGEA